jgi:LacI family transcriptional regulator
VSTRKTSIAKLIGPAAARIPIAVLVDAHLWDEQRLLELAEERAWQLLSLGSTRGALPPSVKLRGALISMLPDTHLADALRAQGVPTIRIGSAPHEQDDLMPAVLPDRAAIGRIAADHFAERDFKHVGFVSRRPWGMNLPTYEAFAKRAEALGGRCHLLQFDERGGGQGTDRHRHRQELFTQWIKAVPKPMGLLAFNDSTAALHCQWIIEAGLRVPEDVAILGTGNNVFICCSAPVPVSSIVPNPREVTDRAVALLDQLIAGRSPASPYEWIAPTGIATRQSTDVLAASDPNVIRALRYMWDHVAEDLSVDQIAKAVEVSRRTLEKAFRRELGRGINQEFQRRRLEKAKELLRQTDAHVAEVAEAMQFSSARQFCRAFRESFGMTPGSYRKKAASAD